MSDIKINKDRLAQQSVVGRVHHPTMTASLYRHTHDGKNSSEVHCFSYIGCFLAPTGRHEKIIQHLGRSVKNLPATFES